MRNRRFTFIVTVIICFMSFLPLFSQQKIIVFVKPFEAVDISQNTAENATEIFRSQLSAINRFNMVSEDQWRTVMRTHGIIMENIALFDKEKDQQIGKLVKADKIISGRIKKYLDGLLVAVDMTDVTTGITNSFSEEMRNEYQLQTTIASIIAEMEKMFISTGSIKTKTNDDQVRIEITGDPDGWTVGSLFDIKNSSGQAYGKVRIENVSHNVAIGQAYDLRDFLRIGDSVVKAKVMIETAKIRPNVGFMNFNSEIDRNIINNLYIKSQTLLSKSNRFNLYDAASVLDVIDGKSKIEIDYYIEGQILEDTNFNSYTVTLCMKTFSTNRIYKQDTEKCIPGDLEKTVEILLYNIIDKFPVTGKVTKIDEKEIIVDLGSNHNIGSKAKFAFKSSDSHILLAEGKVDKLSSDYFSLKQRDEYKNIFRGTLVEMEEDKDIRKENEKRRKEIVENYEENKRRIEKSLAEENKRQEELRLRKEDEQNKAEREKNALAEKKERARLARLAPKSRIKLSLGKFTFEDDRVSDRYEGKKTGNFHAAIYMGDHPNFNIGLHYQYSYFKDNTIVDGSKNSFIAEQAGGLGARLQVTIPFLFSTRLMPFVEGAGKYCKFESKLKPGTKIVTNADSWSGIYVFADGGLEFVFNNNFSFFAQIGLNRKVKLESDKIKFEYMFIDGGMAIWF